MDERMISASLVIPCRDEARFIEKCLRSILAFQVPENSRIEDILFIDGMSTDETCNILEKFSNHDNRIRILKNPNFFHTYAYNIGIRNACGNRIMILNAHSEYPADYFKLHIETAQRVDAENIGGVAVTHAGSSKIGAQLVQALTTHRFGVGNSGFRTGAIEGYADTVSCSFIKRNVFEKIGYYDQRLIRCQDYEFNRRIIHFGGKIWLNPFIQVNYYNQPDLFSFLKKQIIKEAPYNPYMWYLAPYTFTCRHGITGVFATGIIGGLILSIFSKWVYMTFISIMAIYFLLAMGSAIQQTIRYKNIVLALLLPFSFFLYHFIHGLGVIWGLLRLVLHNAPVQKNKIPWDGFEYFKSKKLH